MDMLLIVIGAVMAALALVPYGIYYLGILLGKKTEPVPALECPPTVSIIISAYNEEAVIRKRVENIAASRYPAGHYEVLFIDDCSGDATLAAAREAFAAAGIPHTIIHNES